MFRQVVSSSRCFRRTPMKNFQLQLQNTAKPCPLIVYRNYCEKPTMIPKVNEDEITEKARSVANRMLKLDFIAFCQFMDLLKEKTGIDPAAMADMAGSGGGGAAGSGPAAAEQVTDSGFRKVIIREFTDGGNLPVKEKFAIMKLMRAEQPDLSLAECKQRLDKAPCTVFDKIDKAKAEEIETQLKAISGISVVSEII